MLIISYLSVKINQRLVEFKYRSFTVHEKAESYQPTVEFVPQKPFLSIFCRFLPLKIPTNALFEHILYKNNACKVI